MRPTRRIIIAIGSTLAVAALNAPTASAAPPAREVIPVQSDSIYTNLCAFPLRVQDQGTFIVQTFTDATGFVVRTTTTIPHYRAVLTNQATGYSMEVGAPGPSSSRSTQTGPERGWERVHGSGALSTLRTGSPDFSSSRGGSSSSTTRRETKRPSRSTAMPRTSALRWPDDALRT